MSGGSYNYLFSKEHPAEARGELERMVERLEELGLRDAAAASARFLEGPSDELRDLWRSVEWLDSGDSSEASVLAAAADWRAAEGPVLEPGAGAPAGPRARTSDLAG